MSEPMIDSNGPTSPSSPGVLAEIPVASGNPYTVTIGDGLASLVPALDSALRGATAVLIIHQPALRDRAEAIAAHLSSAGLGASLHELPDAEDGKTLSAAGGCWDACARAGLGRQDAIIGLGGGAATDVAGFIAASWMRGIRVVQVPTTLLGMVDAAVGGKTGINTQAGKNLVGAFHEPAAVLIDLAVLETLPAAELIAGSAEIIKAGFIADPEILEIYERDPEAAIRPGGSLPELIVRAITVKARVVAQDLRESHLREILNYGHTYGHAVEHQEDYRWRHGHAVAVGMVYEAELARAAGLLDSADVDRHRRILTSVGLPVSYAGADLDTLIEVMGRDKKNRDGNIRFVLVTAPGQTTRLDGPSRALMEAAYRATTQPSGSSGDAEADAALDAQIGKVAP